MGGRYRPGRRALNGMPEEALEYSMAAGDAEQAARLTEQLWLPTYRQAITAQSPPGTHGG